MNFETAFGYLGTTMISGVVTVVVMWATQKRQGDRLDRLELANAQHALTIKAAETAIAKLDTSMTVLSETSGIRWTQIEKDLDTIKMTLESQFTQVLNAIQSNANHPKPRGSR